MAITSSDLRLLLERVLGARCEVPVERAVLMAITGIDACGKGHVSAQLVRTLEAHGLRVASIGVDGWLALPQVRFGATNRPEHFYLHAVRFEEMFAKLVLPLRESRSIRLEADFTEETASEYRRHLYEFQDVDVVLLEGIYLLKRPFQELYDLSCWIECSFETALERALARAQEGLPRDETASVYETLYFPAQGIHLERDDPRGAATLTVNNDPRPRRVPLDLCSASWKARP